MHGQHGGDVFATMLTLPSHLEQGLSLYGPSVFSGRPMMSMQMSMISLLHYVSVHGFLFLFIIDSRCHFFPFLHVRFTLLSAVIGLMIVEAINKF